MQPNRPTGLTTLSFRSFLQQELAQRCAGNPQYSLRAFAMHLELDHATLSQLLRGKRAITERLIRRLGERIKLSEDEVTAFVRYESVAAAQTTSAETVMRQLVSDAAKLISDPLYYNLLELVRSDGFQPDSRWIARVLDVTVDEVNVAVTRLLRLGLLEMSDHGRWIEKSALENPTRADFAHLVIRRLVERTNS